MTISLVQHASGTAVYTSGTSATSSVSFASNATAGNCIIACFTLNVENDGETVTSVTMNGVADNWGPAASNANTDDIVSFIWINPDTAGGQKIVDITWAFNGTASSAYNAIIMVDIFEFSGIAASSPLDKDSTGYSSAANTSWSSGATGTTAQAAELWVGTAGISVNIASTTQTVTGPASPWTNETLLGPVGYTYNSSTYDNYQLSGYQVRSSTGAATYSGTNSQDSIYAAVVVTLLGAATPGTGPAFHPKTQALRARLPRQPLLAGRSRSSRGAVSTFSISAYGTLTFHPFGTYGVLPFQYGLLDQDQALLVLDAILLQQPAASAGGINVRLGSSSPTAGTPMTELLSENGYTAGGQACSFGAASSGQITNTSVLSWTNTSGGWLVTGVELWDQAPVRWMFADWTGEPVAVAAGNTFVIPAGGLDIYMY